MNVTKEPLNIRGKYNSLSVGEMDKRDRESADSVVDAVDKKELLSRGQQSQNALTAHLEELVLDGCATVGRLGNGETLPSDLTLKPKLMCAIPGEVEEDLLVYTHCHHTILKFSSTATDHRSHTPQTTAEYQETEEAVPFSLDDTFDYDNVVLSHKHPIQFSKSGSS
ncbi:uncharacterized protein iftap isoform X2 [Hoplias malabaricus]|uniref:uncharacterized protein iftap isoform X2 n=1 Tax=Hoplias malabaricus TaxID=27720 RepID=UPI003463097E